MMELGWSFARGAPWPPRQGLTGGGTPPSPPPNGSPGPSSAPSSPPSGAAPTPPTPSPSTWRSSAPPAPANPPLGDHASGTGRRPGHAGGGGRDQAGRWNEPGAGRAGGGR